MKQKHPILAEIEQYVAAARMSETYFGKKAAGNSELVPRLRDGGGIHFLTEEKVRSFINSNPVAQTAERGQQ